MKKTVLLLLAAAGMAIGETTSPVQHSYDEQTGCYTLTDSNGNSLINNSNVTVALTLNPSIIKNFSEDDAYLFTLNGNRSANNTYKTAIAIQLYKKENGYTIDLCSGNSATYEKDPTYKQWSNEISDYDKLGGHKFDLTSLQSISIILTVEEKGSDDTATGYVFVTDINGETHKYASSFTSNYVDTDNITLLEYDDYLVNNITVYNGCMAPEEVSSLGLELLESTVPEPATTTLSLLALAGLAARRRRR